MRKEEEGGLKVSVALCSLSHQAKARWDFSFIFCFKLKKPAFLVKAGRCPLALESFRGCGLFLSLRAGFAARHR